MTLTLTQIHYSRIQKAQATVMKQKLIRLLKTASVPQLQPTQLQSEVLTGVVAGMAGQLGKVPLQCQAQYLQAAVLVRTKAEGGERAGAGSGAGPGHRQRQICSLEVM